MRTLGSVGALLAAIREEAQVEIERLEGQLYAGLTSHRPGETVEGRDPGSDPRVAAVRVRLTEEASQDEWNAALEDLEDRERWMSAVVALGRERLTRHASPADLRNWLRGLVVEATQHLPAGSCVVVVSPDVMSHLDRAWRDDLARAVGREIAVEAGSLPGGCIVRLADRALAYDNSLDARENRTRGTWRAELARLYATGIAVAEGPAGAAEKEHCADCVGEAPV